jgi:hypothetical protein
MEFAHPQPKIKSHPKKDQYSRSPSFAARASCALAPKSEVSANRFESALGLNYWGFTLTNRSLAFTYATSKAKGENHRADYN